MKARMVFTDSARDDRGAITDFTVKRFGIGQARRLRDRFQRVLKTLAENPLMGSPRAELDPQGHSIRYFLMMNFLVVYRPTESGIEVVRILHTSRDLAAELERDTGGRPDRSLKNRKDANREAMRGDGLRRFQDSISKTGADRLVAGNGRRMTGPWFRASVLRAFLLMPSNSQLRFAGELASRDQSHNKTRP